ncbi:MAG TPA: uroporphyrinogen decarboxylase family protein [bacterium]|nr:uroporphyrinogen decarboxylase family protein [bacterium]
MNGLTRITTALRCGIPDRVPLLEFIIDPTVYRAIVPEAACQADFEEHFDFDAVGTGAKFRSVRENSDGTYFDEWGVLYRRTSEVISHPLRGPVECMRDLEKWKGPDPDADHLYVALDSLVSRFKGQRAVFFHHRAAFMWSAYLHGIDNLLADFLAEPELAHALLDKVLDINLRIIRNAIRRGADVIVLGDDYADNSGPMMSPCVFQEFLLPRLRKTVETIHREGALVVKHTDGNIWKILDDIVETGADGLNPIEPSAGMELSEVKAHCGDRICLLGNIDCGHLLSKGTHEQVREAVQKCIEAGAVGGGFILTSSNSIHSSVRPENYLAMIQAAKEFGSCY